MKILNGFSEQAQKFWRGRLPVNRVPQRFCVVAAITTAGRFFAKTHTVNPDNQPV